MGAQQLERPVDELGVRGIEQAIESLALPEKPDVHPRTELGSDPD